MADLNVAFWNLGNLFDTEPDPISNDFDFRPEEGWTDEVQAAKVANLASVIDEMFDGAGPDLLGVCEVENEDTLQQLVDAITVRSDLQIAKFEDGPDIRGIDCALVFSDTVFEVIDPPGPESHLVHNRYPTRDVFEVPLRVIENGADLLVMVNHWPSRWRGRYATEPLRIAAANHVGRLVDSHLKFTGQEVFDLGDSDDTMDELQARWNRNVLLMGDFNDEPSDRSITAELHAGRDVDKIEEPLKAGTGRATPRIDRYCAQEAFMFNCMWPLLAEPDRGTYHYGADPASTFNVLDHFIVSRGLYFGHAGLQMARRDMTIVDDTTTPPTITTEPTAQIAADVFDVDVMWTSAATKRPKSFDFSLDDNGQASHNDGFSDHFPIVTTIQTV